MALVGGGGAPNVTGSGGTAGTGTGLNYLGNHAYANAGTADVSTSSTTRLNFSTGSEYIVEL